VAAPANDPARFSRSGQILVAASTAKEYAIGDSDGRHPSPLTLEPA